MTSFSSFSPPLASLFAPRFFFLPPSLRFFMSSASLFLMTIAQLGLLLENTSCYQNVVEVRIYVLSPLISCDNKRERHYEFINPMDPMP